MRIPMCCATAHWRKSADPGLGPQVRAAGAPNGLFLPGERMRLTKRDFEVERKLHMDKY
jgi:hypothetical protein